MVSAIHSTGEIPLSNEKAVKLLHQHCDLFYKILTDIKFIPAAGTRVKEGVFQFLSGSDFPFQNCVRGCHQDEQSWDRLIQQQITDFHQANVPFVWLVDESANPKFKEKLIQYGFKDGGILKGVIGDCQAVQAPMEMPKGIDFERVTDQATLKAFNEVISAAFGMNPIGKLFYEQFSWKASQWDGPKLYHWVAKKEGKVVATISSLIDGNTVSFWNGATLPEFRSQGICTALSHLAIEHALSKGCTFGMSYMMAEGLAMGISQKLGGLVKWRFHAFLSPKWLNM